jgi:outer membrane biogenesis lipoprotein LolB
MLTRTAILTLAALLMLGGCTFHAHNHPSTAPYDGVRARHHAIHHHEHAHKGHGATHHRRHHRNPHR